MWVAFALIAASDALAAPCAAPVEASDLHAIVQLAREAERRQDAEVLARVLSEVDWSCLSEVPPPSLAAELHLAQAIAALAQGDTTRATSAARGAIAADRRRVPAAPDPEIAALLAASGSLPTPPAGPAVPADYGVLRVDGASARRVPTERAALVQIVSDDAVQSWYLPGGPPPADLVEALKAPTGSVASVQQIAARAALEEGRIDDARAHLERARAAAPTPEIDEQIDRIDAIYGPVALRAETGVEDLTLQPAEWPLDPEQRACIERAQRELMEQRAFEGRLPAGGYNFSQRRFRVKPGEREPIEVVSRSGSALWSDERGPRLEFSPAWTSLDPTEGASYELGFEPTGFSAPGFRAGLGWQWSFSRRVGALAETGYHFARSTYQAPDWRPSVDLWFVAAGPMFTFGPLWLHAGGVRSSGLVWTAGVCNGPSDECDEDATGTGGPVQGLVRAQGLQADAGLALIELGPLNGSISGGGGILTDQSLRYTWGEIGLTIAP